MRTQASSRSNISKVAYTEQGGTINGSNTPRSGLDRRKASAIDDPVLIRLPVVMYICALSRSCIYEAIKSGTFPAPVKLNGRPSAWIKQEVQNWVRAQIRASRQS